MAAQKNPQTNRQSQTGRPQMPPSYGLQPSGDGASLIPWSWVSERMAASRNYWICTTRPDGRPHVAPVWGVWLDEALYFGSDRQSRKAKNIAANPTVVIHLESGDEVVIIEGDAKLENTPDVLARLYEAYAAKYQINLAEAGSDAPIFAVRPRVALAWVESDFPNTATRWQFD